MLWEDGDCVVAMFHSLLNEKLLQVKHFFSLSNVLGDIPAFMCLDAYVLPWLPNDLAQIQATRSYRELFLNKSRSAEGFNSSLAFQFRLKSHMYCHKILRLACFAFTPQTAPQLEVG